MSRSELMCLMTGGMATIAGGVFAAYVALLGGSNPDENLKFATVSLNEAKNKIGNKNEFFGRD